MPNPLGRSVYLSSFENQQDELQKHCSFGSTVFTSFHISEEFDDSYVSRARRMCEWLGSNGFRILADVSKKTASFFGISDLAAFAQSLAIDALRIDYGFSAAEIEKLAMQLPIVLNASTVDLEAAAKIATAGGRVRAMHNFYPRPETGLDEAFFRASTERLRSAGLEVLAFIPGDAQKRGPLYEGLPTLEEHRYLPPYVGFVDCTVRFQADGVFAGDLALGDEQAALIRNYCETGVVQVPTDLTGAYRSLYGKVFTSRPDSPARMIRFAESREYSCFGRAIEPMGGEARPRGAVTVDNSLYGRYSGEVQLLREALPADSRVNLAGRVRPEYLKLVDCVPNGTKLMLIP